jgi:uncharacterized damage-inducible protein DinB
MAVEQTVTKSFVDCIFDYNYWANRQILAAAAKVSPEQYLAPVDFAHGFPYGSLRNTLVHIYDAEYGWRMLCQHGQVVEDADPAEFPTFDGLVERWRAEEAAMLDYLSGLNDEAMLGFVRYTIPTGEKRERVLWHCLYHVVNHGMQHRGEAAAILTNLGHSPGELDFTVYLNEQAKK